MQTSLTKSSPRLNLQTNMEDTNLTTPVIQTQKPNWLLFALVGMLILTVGIVAGVLIGKYIYTLKPTLSPSPLPSEASAKEGDPTANWKTYTNIKYGYSLKYPTSSTTMANGCEGTNGNKGEEWFQIQTDVTNPSIRAVCGIVSVSPEWWVFVQSGEYKNTLGNNYAVKKQTTMLIGGYPATRYYYHMNPPKEGFDERWRDVTHTVVKLPTKDLTIVIELNLPEKEQFFNQILSTFKFVEQTTPRPTCKPRPACLDATPRCMIPETADMCLPNQKL